MLALLPLGFPPHHHGQGHARRTHEQPPAPPPPVASSVDELVLERTVRRNQEAHSTGYNRESDILTALKQEYTNGATAWRMPKTPKILSFGSSFGLEALAVAELYFPNSVVVGVDVDDATLEKARMNTRNVSDRVFLFNADKLPLASLGSYDVVLAHNVLCHHPWPRHQTPDKWYPLSLFEETLLAISAVLRVGGLLSVVNSNYLLSSAPRVAPFFEPVPNVTIPSRRLIAPIFDAEGRLLWHGGPAAALALVGAPRASPSRQFHASRAPILWRKTSAPPASSLRR